MTTKELIDKEIAELSEDLQRQVYDFVLGLRTRVREPSFPGLALSESTLAKDWDTPEEDQAWANL